MDRKKLIQDMVIMMTLMAVSVLFYWILIPGQVKLSAAWSGNTSFSSRTFPNLLMGLIFIVSATSLARSIFRYCKLIKADASTEKPSSAKDMKAVYTYVKVASVYVIIVVYCILFTKIGYILSSLLIPPVVLFVLGSRKWQQYVYVYGFVVIMYIIFKIVLKVPMV